MKLFIALLFASILSLSAAVNPRGFNGVSTIAADGGSGTNITLTGGTSSGQSASGVYASYEALQAAVTPTNGVTAFVQNIGLFKAVNSVTSTNTSTKLFSGVAGWSWQLVPYNQLFTTRTNVGSGASVTIDPRIRTHYWTPTANATFQILEDVITDTNIDTVVYIELLIADPLTLTNTVNTLTALGDWGNLSVGFNRVELVFQGNNAWTISQDTGEISPTLISGVNGQIGSGKMVLSSGPKLDDYYDLQAITEPGSPDSGDLRLFQDGTGQIKVKNSLGSVLPLGGDNADSVDFEANGTTTDDTPTAIWSNGLSVNNTLYLNAFISAAGQTNTAGYTFDSLTRRASGSPSLIGTNLITTIESDAALNAWFAIDGNDVKLMVKGLAGETIRWTAAGFYLRGTNGSTGGALASPLTQEEFEDATDYDETGWTSIGTGTLDPNYTADPIDGSESLHIVTADSQQRYAYRNFTASSYASAYCRFRPVLHPASDAMILGFFDVSSAIICSVKITTGGSLIITQGATSETTPGALANGTEYHIWMDYSSDGTATVSYSTDGLKPAGGDGVATVSGGSAITDARTIFVGWVFSFSGINEAVWDDVYVDDVEIGSNP
jgi:hypothetical protein